MANVLTTEPHLPATPVEQASSEHADHHEKPSKPLTIWQRIVWNIKNAVAKIIGDDPSATNHHAPHAPASHQPHPKKPEDKAEPAPEKFEPKIAETKLEGVELLMKKFKPELKHILYPCCDTHSLKKTFPDSQVTYVDINERAMKAMTKAGYDAHCMSALDFKPQHDPDLLVLFNQFIKKDEIHKIAEHIKPGKYILCNDYHIAAEAMHEHPDFECVGIVEKTGTFDGRTGENKLVTENLEKYFKKKEGQNDNPFQRHYEAGGIDDYYFFRRKKTNTSAQALSKPA